MNTHICPHPNLMILKAARPLRRMLLGGLLLALTSTGLALERSRESALTSPALKVEVNTPPSWNLLIDDRVSEWFVDGVRTELSRYGFSGDVEEVRYPDDPAQAPFLLTINVQEWRLDRIGNIDCTITATLHTPDGERRLGVYSNTLPRWFGGFGRWGLQRAFEEAADGAINDLCRDLVRSELIPGLREIAA